MKSKDNVKLEINIDQLEPELLNKLFPHTYDKPEHKETWHNNELIIENMGLHWDLVDAQMDANRISRMYLELCEAAAPWMDKIQERRRTKEFFSSVNEAKMVRKKLQDSPRVRDENPQVFMESSIYMNNIYPAPSSGGTIAIHLHLYYVDLAYEFIEYFRNIPFPFDLYISCKMEEDHEWICRQFSEIEMAETVIVRKTKNRGRDIAPLYVLFGKEIAQHDFFLHVHSKKSLYTGQEQTEWRSNAMSALCGSELQVRRIMGLLQSAKNVGLIFPETYDCMPLFANSWCSNGYWKNELAKKYHFDTSETIFNYPVGSFFWARTKAIKPLFDNEYVYEDFEIEDGQTDGTLAHGLERAIALLTKSRGYTLAILDSESEMVRFGKSEAMLNGYFKETLASAKKILSNYDIVSFDIFDTLITRKIYDPDDVFYILAEQFKNKYGYQIDFIKIRKEAENHAWKKLGAKTNINDIYDEFAKILKIDIVTANEIKELEIQLELECCIPRKDVLKLFKYLCRKQIKICLVSDMYLPKDIIEKMLQKCGYEGYSELIVSCDIGLRKDDGSLWKMLKNLWIDKKVIHIGDNFASDMQIPVDNKFDFYPVLNPRTMLQISSLYEYIRDGIKPSVEISYMLGSLVNEHLFNSPFALESCEKLRRIEIPQVGAMLFAPTLLSFTQAIELYATQEQQLWFLSREGYFLQKLYQEYTVASGRYQNSNVYFLASRRAVSVAAIRSEADVRNILLDYYVGTLGNVLKTRLGIDVPYELSRQFVKLPEKTDVVMELLRPCMDQILEAANEERNLYEEYVETIRSNDEELPPVVIDLGYSGTIQYNLALMLDKQIDGFYLYTETNKKPCRIGCTCESIFSREGDYCGDAISNNSLYLESILQAPYGQFVRFIKEDVENVNIVPCYREDAMPPKEIFTMQNAVLEYAYKFAEFEKKTCQKIYIEPEIAIKSFLGLVQSGILPDEIYAIFTVEDNYCGQGMKYLDLNTMRWVAK